MNEVQIEVFDTELSEISTVPTKLETKTHLFQTLKTTLSNGLIIDSTPLGSNPQLFPLQPAIPDSLPRLGFISVDLRLISIALTKGENGGTNLRGIDMVESDLDGLLRLIRGDVLRDLPCSEPDCGDVASVVELDWGEGHDGVLGMVGYGEREGEGRGHDAYSTYTPWDSVADVTRRTGHVRLPIADPVKTPCIWLIHIRIGRDPIRQLIRHFGTIQSGI